MKLFKALVKSGRVMTAKSESRKPISRYMKTIIDNDKIFNMAWIRTPRGIYFLFSSKRRIDSKDDYTISIARESYNGNREHVANIITNNLKILEDWLNDRKKSIIAVDFKDRKYIMPRYEI